MRLLLVLVAVLPSIAAAQARPPVAARTAFADTIHGTVVPDPYRWLEDLDAPGTVAWVRGQDEWTRAFVGGVPGRQELATVIGGAATARRTGTPVAAGGRYFYTTSRTTGGSLQVEAVWMRESIDGRPRKIVDGDSLGRLGLRLTMMQPSPDGRLLGVGVGPIGSSWIRFEVRDVDRGTPTADRLEGLVRGRSQIHWRADGSGFYYSAFDPPAGPGIRTAALGDHRVFFHRLGDAQRNDSLVFSPPAGSGWAVTTSLTADDRTLVIAPKEPASPGNRIYLVDRNRTGPPTLLIGGFGETFTFVGSDGDRFWFQTDAAAPRGRVIAINRRNPDRAHWIELVPERSEPITNWLGVSAVGGSLAVGYLADARHVVRVHASTGEFRYQLELPRELGSLWTGIVGRQDSPEAFYTLSGLVDPGTVFRLDIRTGRSEEFAGASLPYPLDRYRTRQVFYPGRDGTRIPMFLVERRDRPAGPAPVLMYGYAFDWAAAPWFQPAMVAWLDLGGVWALPNTRGGTEYGEAWNLAGSRLRKQTAIDDYLAAAEWLVAEGITTRKLMVANASSAGGAVGGAAVVQRPDLFGAAVLDYPLLDMLRYDRFTGAAAWSHEYGTTADPEEFRALLGYSPYHNVRPGACYPATLVAPGELDQVTPPLHAYKYVAALQAAQACDAPIVLRVAWGAGHAAGTTAEAATAMWVDQLSFLIRTLDWTPRRLATQ